MRIFRQFGVLLLLLLSCLAPAMACMPASHGCCQKTPPSLHDNALDTKAVTFHPVAAPIVWLAAFELVNPPSTAIGWVEHPDYSPPKSPPATISILRI
jgi:hypothetical protein